MCIYMRLNCIDFNFLFVGYFRGVGCVVIVEQGLLEVVSPPVGTLIIRFATLVISREIKVFPALYAIRLTAQQH